MSAWTSRSSRLAALVLLLTASVILHWVDPTQPSPVSPAATPVAQGEPGAKPSSQSAQPFPHRRPAIEERGADLFAVTAAATFATKTTSAPAHPPSVPHAPPYPAAGLSAATPRAPVMPAPPPGPMTSTTPPGTAFTSLPAGSSAASAFPYQTLGRYEMEGRVFVFLRSEQGVIAATSGATLDGAWRIDTITPHAMTATHLPTMHPYTVSLAIAL